jgi:hypothetical protein
MTIFDQHSRSKNSDGRASIAAKEKPRRLGNGTARVQQPMLRKGSSLPFAEGWSCSQGVCSREAAHPATSAVLITELESLTARNMVRMSQVS